MRSRRDRTSPFAALWAVIKIAAVLTLCFAATAVVYTFRNITNEIPDEKSIENYTPSQPTRIVSYDNVVLAVISAAENREFVPVSAIPQNLKNATIAIEDSSFYSHAGMSFRGTVRALWVDLTRHSFTQGGSTITQELARNLEDSSGHSYTGHQKSVSRKINEAILAMELERHFAKDEILELYLNQVFYGSQAYGVQAASETYFGKPVADLDLAQCALIAGLPQRPTDYDPYKNVLRAIRRRNVVLSRMRQLGYITSDQEQAARAETPVFHRMASAYRKWLAPYFVDYILKQLTHKYGEDMVHRGGLTVYTTLNYRMERAAEQALANQIAEAKIEHKNVHQMALVSIDQHTGYVKAMVGGVGPYEHNQYNRAIHPRQPGSSFKLFDYTTAIEDGMTPEDTVDDSPQSYYAGQGKWWTPKNYDGKYRGMVTIRDALAYSENTVAVKVVERLGIRRVLAVALKMGAQSDPFCEHRPLSPYLPSAIGASVIAPLEMCVSYATTAADGVFHPAVSILRVNDHNGSTLFDAGTPVAQRVVPADVADQMNDMLHSVVEYGTGTKANIFPKVWGKTGTTQDDRDAWWIGFTPELTTAVWAGNDHYLNAMDSVHGGSLCAGAWDDYMKVAVPLMQRYHTDNSAEMAAALADQPGEHSPTAAGAAGADTTQPAKVKVKICLDSGLLATATCPRTAYRTFVNGTAPTQSCPLDHSSDETQVYICPVSGKLATQYCPNPVLKAFPSDKAPTQFCDVHRGPG